MGIPDKILAYGCFFVTVRILCAFYMIEAVKRGYQTRCLVLYATEMCGGFLNCLKVSVKLFRRNEK